MAKKTLITLMILISSYLSVWLFNHINAWLGLLCLLLTILLTIKIISNKLNKLK